MELKYRPEIDGLRAIAVIAVMLYHAQITIDGNQPFNGGFIGVDIFFVISGYLITSIIFKELLSTGSFSFSYFYQRRIRRIFPALFLVMFTSFLFGWIILLPANFIDFSKSILYSLGFISNLYFFFTDQVYNTVSGLLKPFLHTWSLSIEEQFYILFPITLLIIFKYLKKYIIHILILCFILSLGLAEWTSRNFPPISFYFLHTRVWELLAGSLLAYIEITKGHRNNIKILNKILPLVGLILIFHSIFYFNDSMFHPSLYTLSPIIGVCLIIWFSEKDEIVTKILSNKFLVGIGLISYSLYLWHYPIFAFVRITGFLTGNMTGKILLIPFILVLSTITFYLVEKPIRNKKIKFKNISFFISIAILLLVSLNLFVINKDGIKERLPEILQLNLQSKNNKLFQDDKLQKIVLIGDSHANALEHDLNNKIKKNNLSLYSFNTELFLTKFNYVHKANNKIDENFYKKNNIIDNFINENTNLVIIMHYRWMIRIFEKNSQNNKDNIDFNSYFQPVDVKKSSKDERQKYIVEKFISEIENILNLGHKIILVYPVPEMNFNVSRLFMNNFIKNNKIFDKKSIPILSSSYEEYKKANIAVFELLDSIKHPNVYRVYPHKFFCDNQIKNECVANNDTEIFYYDEDHLSLKGSEFITNDILQKIKIIVPQEDNL